MQCVKCGSENSPNAKFCRGCGNKLEVIEQVTTGSSVKCSKCGHANESGKKYCPKCGTPLITDIPNTETSVPPVSPPAAAVLNHTAVQSTPVKGDHRNMVVGIVIAVVVLLCALGGGYWYYQKTATLAKGKHPSVSAHTRKSQSPATTTIPALQVPPINITRAIIATGVNTDQVPFGIDTNFYSGTKRLFYYVSYNGAIANSTVFVFKWYKYDNEIRESTFTLRYASGNVWNFLDYDFQPGQYEARAYANGQLLARTSFSVSESFKKAKKAKKEKKEKIIISPLKGQSEQQQAIDRSECHGWAVGQTGYDPTQPSPSDKYNEYHRAMCACLEGRGYTAK